MAKCPKCGAGIEYLRNYALIWRELRFTVENGIPRHEPSGDIIFSEPVEEEYVCPECDALLFKAEGTGTSKIDEAEKRAKEFLESKQ